MCRFVAYIGAPTLIDRILVNPSNSLVSQSFSALESEMTVNGDGFGLGWYNKSIKEEPGRYVSVLPAWNDQNLLNNASITESNCFLAHVRAATVGSVSLENCHPFEYNEYLMMHNGGINDFDRIKQSLSTLLDEEAFLWIKGQSDTQYIFALFMTNARKMGIGEFPEAEILVNCFNKTFADIEGLKKAKGINSVSIYNMVLSNGYGLIATRYSTQPKADSRTLYFTENVSCKLNVKGDLEFEKGKIERSAALISSEKLTEDDMFWKEIPSNHAVYINRELEVTLLKLD